MTKVIELKEAISRHIKPGMVLHMAGGIGGPSAAICEIIRQFHGKNPGFTLVQSTITGHALNMLNAGFLKKVIFTACIDISNASRPSKKMQRIWADNSIEKENWSLLTLQQRLMAGALGVAFMPTRSIAGSNLATYNSNSYGQIANPFNKNEMVGLVQSLNPDISIVHGSAADIYGNTILPVPYGDDIWGSLASKNGVLVTVEKVVSAEELSRHAALVKIPGFMVKSVSVAPMGQHPFSHAHPSLEGIKGYETDINFLNDMRAASKSDEDYEKWLKNWVLDCTGWEDYIKRLGQQKVNSLYFVGGKAANAAGKIPGNGINKVSPEDMIMVAAAREIMAAVKNGGYRLMLAGAGSRALAVIIAFHLLREQGYDIELLTGNGQMGYEPGFEEISTQSISSVYTSKMLTDTITSQGVFVSGSGRKCLSVIGAGQIDKHGNINSTLTSDGKFLVGSGGGNDSVNAPEVILIANQDQNKYVDRLPYITGSGNNVSTVVSDMAIYKRGQGNELLLTACLPVEGMPGMDDRIKRIQENCGWTIKLADHVRDVEPPDAKEMKMLELLHNKKNS